MTKIRVTKMNFVPGQKQSCIVDSEQLGGGGWPSFYLKTNFCRLEPKFTMVNRTSRVGYNGPIYIVEADGRRVIYDSNFLSDNARYKLVKDFVEYVLSLDVCE